MSNPIFEKRPRAALSRRALIGYAGLAGLGLPLIAGCTRATPETEDPHSSSPRARVSAPSFSRTERDRRWAAVRAAMGRPPWNLDAILVPGMTDQAYARYLTQIGGRGGGADVIFPRDATKPVMALVGGARNADFWRQRLGDWTADGKLTLSDQGGSSAVAEGMKSLGVGAAGARIGVTKLTGSRFDPEGLVSSTYLEKLQNALGTVVFVGIEQWGVDPGPIDGSAILKSDEEHDVVRAAARAGENGIRTLVAAARSAKVQADLWFPTFYAMFLETGEDPTRLSISLDRASNSTLGAPTSDPVKEGQIVSQEIDATAQGYRAQVNHSFFVGTPRTPGYDYYAETMKVCVDAFLDGLAFIVPGKTTCGELVDHYAAFVEKSTAEDQSGVVLHSSGIGNLSRPRLGPSNSKADGPIVLQPGMAFNFKPALRLKRTHAQDVGPENRVVQLGDHVLVTDAGAIRLGKRELGPLVTMPDA